MRRLAEMTNATKAQIIITINAIFAFLQAFGVDMTDAQEGATIVLVNALLALWVGLTYNYSRKRQE
jgi:phage terminase large subunit-like protein